MAVVRLGTVDDFDAAVDVWRRSNEARRGGIPVIPEQEQRVLGYRNLPGSFLVVAEDQGQIVGMALGMQAKEDDGAGPPVPGLCHVSMVFVAPERWGEGIGRSIMNFVLDQAVKRGFSRAQLWTHADNARAQRLYASLGFVPSGRQKADDAGDLIAHYELSM